MTRMVLCKCANPKCWRYFPKAVDSVARCCDETCERQAQAVEAQQARTKRGAA
jgi:hypothetical protein